jgi:hypothetical protein
VEATWSSTGTSGVARVRAVMEFIVETFERDAALWNGESS